jgi:UDP-N-acetylglucosamine--N-acetylmuramyl-(pentapeptide) pyrophosphoryl-undecaprenol N-acetylglucosamine transferase
MRILFTGGGTGGHFYPIIAVIREIKKIVEEERLVGAHLYYIGPDDFGKELLKKEEVRFIHIMSGKWRRYVSVLNIVDIFKIVLGTFKALWILFSVMPDIIFSKGGYGSIPALAVAIIY